MRFIAIYSEPRKPTAEARKDVEIRAVQESGRQ
jgi:hypothetical protein